MTAAGSGSTRSRSADDVARLGTILGLWAHPQDEALFSGGLMTLARDAGSRVVVVTATRGERGTTHPGRWPPERLGRLRSDELAASLAVLGVAEHCWLNYPDGVCADVARAVAVEQLRHLIDEVSPDTIVSFGPEGVTGHADHRTVSEWATAAWDAVGRRPTLLYATSTATTPADELAVHLPLEGPALARKLAALRAHASQWSALHRDEAFASLSPWCESEAFRAAAHT
jgi:LmbE family N-acetylglucosaminyl deacetylase